MIALLRSLAGWIARHMAIFVLIAIALWGTARIYQAWRAVPQLRGEVAALEGQERELERIVAREMAAARQKQQRLATMEAAALGQRLRAIRAELTALDGERYGRAGLALDVLRGDTERIAGQLGAGLRVRLLQREEAVILARLRSIAGDRRAQGLASEIAALDARAAALEQQIAAIERRHPILSKAESVLVLRNLEGPWRELSRARGELRAVQARRAQAMQVQAAAQRAAQALAAVYARAQAQMLSVPPPGATLTRLIEERRAELSQNWAHRAWTAIEPVLGAALWITLLVIVVPPATKAFWFFVVAPAASRLRPITLAGDLGSEAYWGRPEAGNETSVRGSGVSRPVVLRPGDELLIKPEFLQSSMNRARIDSALVLSWSIPLGSLATGLVGLTRIRVDRRETATVSATQDLFDEVALIHVPAGSGLVFKPRGLIGVVQRVDRPARIRRVWRLGHLSAWLTLQLRFLVFEGPCTLVVKGARGVALEPADTGRRISGTATLGWSAGVGYSVRRSETFLAYLAGKQSLFNDSFEGEGGCVVYEEVPRAATGAGIFSRGLEGLGDGLMKVVGL
ncbi:hypothetical protein E2493_17070 [Sphingomonas parva]|uniref:Uncharacterized protein n=1 Tax=Sphingomonas parva TaxID=2555898 RepID=A0A4Y8ZM85_9SPHN|nr:hypothetical protein [Sphingomonas parva]TFI57064.1 hypothetical protein E2493_17070 [Sphingomonas parva]